MMLIYVSVILAVLWVMEGTLKDIKDKLSYLIDLLDPNANSTKEQDNQDKEQESQTLSREDLYK